MQQLHEAKGAPMGKPTKPKYRPSDIDDAERRYAETKDPMFLALAVGAMPHQPPLWVISECAALVETVAQYADQGNDQQRMGRRLDAMWLYFYSTPDRRVLDERGYTKSNPGPSIAEAARHALAEIDDCLPGHRSFEANHRNLLRAWAAERNAADPEGEDFLFDGLIPTPRSNRILLEWGDRDAGKPYRHISLQIARHERGAV